MPEISPRLSLSFIQPQQSQKHVTVNETVRRLDALVQLAVLSRSVSVQPAAPAEGDQYILPSGRTGAEWGVMAVGAVAAFQDGVWTAIVPKAGWRAWVVAETRLLVFTGAAWSDATGAASAAPQFGVNATADATNRLAVKANAALFNHDDVTPGTGDHRLIVNKSTAARTGSVIFQTAASGRAEFGLAGDDDFRVKVSADGVSWRDALVVNRTTGAVSLPNTGAIADWSATAGAAQILNKPTLAAVAASGSAADLSAGVLAAARMPAFSGDVTTVVGATTTTIAANAVTNAKLATMPANTLKLNNTGASATPIDGTPAQARALLSVREQLTADRTYYVRTDGNDANTGLSNSAGGAFLTVQKAVDAAASLDIGVYNVVIEVASGTYSGLVTLKNGVGGGLVTLRNTTGGTATLATSVGPTISAVGLQSRWALGAGLLVQTTTSGSTLYLDTSRVTLSGINFGAASGGGYHVVADRSSVYIDSNYTISGAAAGHAFVSTQSSFVYLGPRTVTLTGTPAFSDAFVRATTNSSVRAPAITFSGSATGVRYAADLNSAINTSGGGASYFPGNSAGSTASGGQYA